MSKKRKTNPVPSDRIKKLDGKIFGKLTVLSFDGIKNKLAYWKCKCECGEILSVAGTKLTSNSKKRRACKTCSFPIGNKRTQFTGYEEIGGMVFSKIKAKAKERNLEFDIDIKYIWDLFIKQDRKCALSGMSIGFSEKTTKLKENTASLDRIDSSKGYIPGNVQWVHKRINLLKLFLPEDRMFELVKLIVEYNDL
jgi:hypothetical protein